MPIKRQLPKSDEARDRALTLAKNRKDNASPADMALTAATQSRLDAVQPDFKARMQTRGDARRDQTLYTEAVITTKRYAIMFISHFLQVFNMGVKRGRYSPQDRSFYQLPVNSEKLPEVNTEAEIIQWGGRIETGDASRVAAGGADMQNPEAAEVAGMVSSFSSLNNEQANKKLAYDQAQEAVEALRTEADAVIKKVWDEVETFYNEETIASKRRKAREWGVVYISDMDEIIHVTVTGQADNAPIAEAEITLLETGDIFHTGLDGKKDIRTGIENSVTLRTSHPDYSTIDTTIVFQNGVHEYEAMIQLAQA